MSGVFALDIDPRHSGDDSLDRIVSKCGRISDDVMAVTGSGGAHYLFKHPGKDGRSTTNLWPGIDTRGDGGYIVVAPSNHISGGAYFWDAEADPLAGAILPEAPGWLLKQLAEKNRTPLPEPTTSKNLPPDEIRRIRAALVYVSADDRDQWRTIGMALHSSGAGDQAFGVWCEWSQQSDKFDLKDQRRVWDSFKPGGGITLSAVFGIAKQNGWLPPEPVRQSEPPLSVYENEAKQGLSDKKPKTKNAKQRGGNKPAADLSLLQRFVFLKNHNRIFDTVTRNELSRDGFDGAFLHLFHDQKPSTFFLKNPSTIKVDGLIYLPGETGNPVKRDGAVLWNIWLDPGVSLPDVATRQDVEP